uniref:Uncharacterized protein n=1 Tax=Rangifer tarandus platyrhynchus TaxID=3082113 RepID=A0ACB0EY53_RANTA|nr:unnamed protein product [Rangifer tarandus platyrhynchus]
MTEPPATRDAVGGQARAWLSPRGRLFLSVFRGACDWGPRCGRPTGKWSAGFFLPLTWPPGALLWAWPGLGALSGRDTLDSGLAGRATNACFLVLRGLGLRYHCHETAQN